MNWILFGIYLLCVILIFVFISIVLMHIGEFRQYSKYITPILRIYLIVIVLIALFGAYKVLTSRVMPTLTDSPTVTPKTYLEF